MKIPSVHLLLVQVKKVLFRFPLESILTIFAVIVALIMVDSSDEKITSLLRMLFFCWLSFTLVLAVDLFVEANHVSPLSKWISRLLALAIPALIMSHLNQKLWMVDNLVVLFFGIAFHLMVSYAAFINGKSVISFWHFNKTLFLRFLTSILYSGVITLGLFAALAAANELFNMNVRPESYLRIFIVAGIGFNTIFFLSGVPLITESNNNDEKYPKALKIFTQFVLIPLMTVYLIILVLYELKIAMEWRLPDGYVSTLILGYAVFGILSLLLVYPIRENEGNKWIRWFSRFFYVMMVPLIVLLIMAIYKRVSAYGITEERYVLIVLSLWLTAITIYFLLSRKQNIKVIPITLSSIALWAAAGPQSAKDVSEWSQTRRLEKYIKSTSEERKKEILSIVNYLVTNHGLTSLQDFTGKNMVRIQESILSKSSRLSDYEIHSDLKDTAFSILHITDIDSQNEIRNNHFEIVQNTFLPVSGYDYIYEFGSFGKNEELNAADFKLKIDREEILQLKVIINNENATFNMDSLCRSAAEKNRSQLTSERQFVPAETLSLEKDLAGYAVRVQLKNFNLRYNRNDHSEALNDYDGYLLVKKKF